jgi:PiT family inorganic phosphate transporter
MAGMFNLCGGLTGTAVALMIGTGLVAPSALSLAAVVAALAGAMVRRLFTYFFGIPVSETHGLIGGLVGGSVGTTGLGMVQRQGLTTALLTIIASPSVGFVDGSAFLLRVRASHPRAQPFCSSTTV